MTMIKKPTVSLRGRNCRFWFHLGFWDGRPIYMYLPKKALLWVVCKEVPTINATTVLEYGLPRVSISTND